MLTHRNAKRWMLLLFAVVLLVVVSKASAAQATGSVPAEVQFVKPPLAYSWGKVMVYRLRLTSNSSKVSNVYLSFTPYIVDQLPEPGAGGKGGQPEYGRTYQLKPYEAKDITFRVMAPAIGLKGIWDWCLRASLGVKGAAIQGIWTCAVLGQDQ